MSESAGTSPPRTALRLRFDEFDRLAKLRGWHSDAEIARQLKISQATLTNLRRGRVAVGPKVIHACNRAFGAATYDVLFEQGAA